MGFVLTITAVLAAIWGVTRFAWGRSAERRACNAAWAAVQAVRRELDQLRLLPERARERLSGEARAYVEAQRSAARSAVAIEDLRDFGARNVRWAGLREAGIGTLDDLGRGSWGGLQQLPGIGAASAEKIAEAARAALRVIDAAPIPLPGPALERPRSADLVAAVAASASAPALLVEHAGWMDGRTRDLATGAHRLRRRATFLRWLLKSQNRGSGDSVLDEAAALRELATATRGSPELAAVRTKVRAWEQRWPENPSDSGVASPLRTAYASLVEHVRAALAPYGAVGSPEPAYRATPAASARRPLESAVSEELVTFRVTDDGGYRPAPARAAEAAAPRREAARQDARWIPPGETIEVAGFRIPGGMVYVGERIAPIARPGLDDPALIQPSLPIDRRRPDRAGEGMTYWPWYGRIPEASRAAFLEWLAGGRRDPDISIGYVFLFFYGLERRLLSDALSDASARREEQAILAEIRRLLAIYGSNGSFRGYARGLIDVIEARQTGAEAIGAGPPPEVAEGEEASLRLKIGLGQLVTAARPIPADWALAWLRSTPGASRRAERSCPEEFSTLFRVRYAQRFGAGLQVSRNRTPLVARYQPASAAFMGPVTVPIEDLPDVSALSAPIQKLADLASECAEALAPFARWLVRHPEDRDSPAAAATLPADLSARAAGARVAELASWVEACLRGTDSAEVAVCDLLERWSGDRRHKLAKPEAVLVGQFLEHRGVGLEPDVRFSGEVLDPDGKAVLFKTPERLSAAPTAAYAAAALLLRLGCVVAGADKAIGAAEEAFLAERVQSVLHLPPAEQARLRAHVRWLLASRTGTGGLKKRVASLEPGQRAQVADFVIGVAAADGRIEPGEVKSLQQVFTLLGLDPADVYARIHGMGGSATVQRGATDGTAKTGAASAPQAPGSARKPAGTEGIALDPKLVAARLAESEAVFGVLKDIFASTEVAHAEPSTPPVPGIWGLDSAHSALVRALIGRETWTRGDYEDLAKSLHLLPAGAVETVNEAAFEAAGEPLIEGDETLTVHSVLLEESVR